MHLASRQIICGITFSRYFMIFLFPRVLVVRLTGHFESKMVYHLQKLAVSARWKQPAVTGGEAEMEMRKFPDFRRWELETSEISGRLS